MTRARRREFVFEGQRWFDLARWGQLDAAVRAKQAELNSPTVPVRGVRNTLLPIPQRELDVNPKLTQNDGY